MISFEMSGHSAIWLISWVSCYKLWQNKFFGHIMVLAPVFNYHLYYQILPIWSGLNLDLVYEK